MARSARAQRRNLKPLRLYLRQKGSGLSGIKGIICLWVVLKYSVQEFSSHLKATSFNGNLSGT